MTTAESTQRPRRADDPYFYGWRHVSATGPDGKPQSKTIPLTEWDVLHPREGDYIVNNSVHDDDCIYLKSVIRERLSGDPSALVLSDCGVYWDVGGPEHHSPDISVISGIRRPRDRWPSFNVAVEGVRPALIIEITSPSTRKVDFTDKVAEYHSVRIPQYVIMDEAIDRLGRRTLTPTDHHWTPDGWTIRPPDADGRVPLDAVGLLLGSRDGRVRLYDGTGAELGDYSEVVRAARDAESARRQAESARQQAESARRQAEGRAAAAEARIRELEAELRRLRSEP